MRAAPVLPSGEVSQVKNHSDRARVPPHLSHVDVTATREKHTSMHLGFVERGLHTPQPHLIGTVPDE